MFWVSLQCLQTRFPSAKFVIFLCKMLSLTQVTLPLADRSLDTFPLEHTPRHDYAMTDECFISTFQFMLTSKTCYDFKDWNGTNNTNTRAEALLGGELSLRQSFPLTRAFNSVSKVKCKQHSFLFECFFALYPIWKHAVFVEWSTLDAALSWYSLFTSCACEVERKSQGAEWSYLRASQPGPLPPHISALFPDFAGLTWHSVFLNCW